MRSLAWAAGAAALSAGALCSPAFANAGPELRVGVLEHNTAAFNSNTGGKESGPDVSIELALASPDWLAWAGGPRPYLNATVNTAGATSYGAVGLEWQWQIGGGWSVEPGLGYAIHNGEIENPFPASDPRKIPFENENVLFGSRDLFRVSLSTTYEVAPGWGIQALYEHLSHGQILGSGRNQGIDNIGLRVAYRFGDG